LGGFRYETNGGQWDGVDAWQMAYMLYNHNPEELYYKSTAPSDNMAGLRGGTAVSWGHVWSNKDFSKLAPKGEVQLLLKTGAPGIPDDPQDYPPITSIDDLRKEVAKPDFYNQNYKYSNYDSLGSNGGKYSGGFMDTYIGQTQLHFAIPKGQFVVNGTNVTAMGGDNAKQYYMALGIGQEFLRVDAQWMFAMGAKETFSGTDQTPWATDVTSSGNYTNWHVESPTMLDRALGYSQFFPKYAARLSAARDVTSSGIGIPEFANYYVGGYNGQTSPRTINGLFVSALVQYVNYDVFAQASDICWKYALEKSSECGDPYMGLAAMVAAYNLGQWGQIGTVKGLLNNNSVDGVACDKNARNRFATGNNNYRTEIINVAQKLIDASRDFEKGNGANSELIDFKITLDQLREMFFGAGGTVAKQGDGGILIFYYDPDAGKDVSAIRQKIWNTLGEAFDVLKGKAPSADANTISYRYDFLSAIRTVKSELPYERRFKQTGDASTLIPQNSATGCAKESGGVVDEKYPFIDDLKIIPNEDVCAVEVKMRDDNFCSKVQWTIDYDWATWNTAVMVENAPAKTNNFKFEIPKSMADGFRNRGDGSGEYVWVIAEDASGNSVVKKAKISFIKLFQRPEPKWAAVFDTTGDGYPDIIKAQIIRNDLGSFTNAQYSWKWNSSKGVITNSAINPVGNDFSVKIDLPKEGAGSGWLYMEYDSLDEKGNKTTTRIKDSVALVDSCGPAIKNADFYPYEINNPSKPDTLIVEFTEKITGVEAGGVLLIFAEDEKGTNPLYATVIDAYEENGKWVFLYNSGEIAPDRKLAYGYVKIKFDCGITDNSPQYNPPLEKNKWASLSDHTKSSLLPTIVSAEMFDNWGSQGGRLDGAGDSLFVRLELSKEDDAYTARQIDSVEIVFGGEKTSGKVYSNSNGDGFYFIDRSLTSGCDDKGGIKIIFLSGEAVTGKINDKIAPVIISASYERYDDKKDVLRVKYSEPISSAGDSPIIADKSGSHRLEVKSFNGDSAVYEVADGSHFVYGDSIWILADKGVKDAAAMGKNEQTNEKNRRVKIDYFRYIEIKIQSAAYLDVSNPADGYIDEIKIDFNFGEDGKLNPKFVPDIKNLLAQKGTTTLPEKRYFSEIKADDIDVFAEHSLKIQVSQDRKKVKVPRTYTDKDDIISFNGRIKTADTLGIYVEKEKFYIDDEIAPVITRARFNPMQIESGDVEKITDTLYLHFSEPIQNVTSVEIKAFDAKSPSRNYPLYRFKFNEIRCLPNPADSVAQFLIDYTEGDTLPVRNETEPDSIRIAGGEGIYDFAGNPQNTNTVYVEIEVGRYSFSYDVKIYPNPYYNDPSTNKFDTKGGMVDKNPAIEKYLNGENSTDMAVVVKPIGDRSGGGNLTDLSGRIFVLDQLGNKLVDGGEFKQGRDGVLIWTWDGKNKNRRAVSAGFYQAIIQVTNKTENETKTLQRKIGIKK